METSWNNLNTKMHILAEIRISECFVFKFFYSSPENEFTCHRHWLFFPLSSYMYILNSINVSMSYVYYCIDMDLFQLNMYIHYNCISCSVAELWGAIEPLQYKLLKASKNILYEKKYDRELEFKFHKFWTFWVLWIVIDTPNMKFEVTATDSLKCY